MFQQKRLYLLQKNILTPLKSCVSRRRPVYWEKVIAFFIGPDKEGFRVFRRKRLMSFDLDDRAFRSGCLLLFTSCCQLECRQQDEEWLFVRGRLFFELGDHDIIIVVIVDRVLKIGQLFTHFGGDILVFQRVLDVGHEVTGFDIPDIIAI